VVVATWDAGLGAANATADAASAARDVAHDLTMCPVDSALDLTLCPITSACDQRDEVMVAYQDEEMCLESLERDLVLQTHCLRDTAP